MKPLTAPTIALIITLTSGCASEIPLSLHERCAARGMVLQGLTETSGTSTGFAVGSGYSSAVGVGGSDSESLSCSIPKTPKEQCEVSNLTKEISPKAEYNDGITGKKWVTGIGYVLYIVPGVVAKVIYDGQKDAALKKSQALVEASSKCE